jgi:hypothetical protein
MEVLMTWLLRLALVLTSGLISSPAYAIGFVNNRAEWQALTQEAKIGYVQALNDSLNYIFVDDNLVDALAKRGRTVCLIEKRMTAAMLVTYMNMHYQSDKMAQLSPTAVYIVKVTDMCRDYINSVRQEYGLGPL